MAKKIIIGVAVVVALAALWQFGAFDAVLGSGAYQAVFLTNNQVYFGKVARPNAQYVVLRDIYYLQVTQQLQPPADQPVTNVQLVKLGSELHGPKDEMRINRDQILFIEDLKPDSQVVTAIQNFQGAGN